MIYKIKSLFKKRPKTSGPIRIGIKWQLSLLACCSALCALGILAVATAVVIHSTVLDIRSDRLKVVAQLKAAQVSQVLSLLVADSIVLSSRSFVNTVVTDFYELSQPKDSSSARDFQMVLQSSDNNVAGAIYSYNYTGIVYRIDNHTISTRTHLPEALFPLNSTLSQNSIDLLNRGDSIISGPRLIKNWYCISVTRALTKQGLDPPGIPGNILGYLTIASNASSLLDVVKTTDLDDGSLMSLIKLNTELPRKAIPRNARSTEFNYSYVTPNLIWPHHYGRQIPLEPNSPEYFALVNGTSGAMIDYYFPKYGMVSTGFAPVATIPQIWGVVVFQSHKYVYEPIRMIRNISLISVFSVGAGVCVATLVLSGWILRPVTRLQAATEMSNNGPRHSSGFWFFKSRLFFKLFSKSSSKDQKPKLEKNAKGMESNTEVSKQRWLNNYSRQASPTFKLPEQVVTRKYIRDELTELTETFNEMTTELHKQYRHLEERVEERKKEIKEAKNLAETANEAKSLFIASITHELRTPLNGILGMASVAMEEGDSKSVKESLKVIFRSGELLLRLLTDLLCFSRSEVENANNMKLEIRGFRIDEVTSQLHAIFDESSKAAKIDFLISMENSEWLKEYELNGDVNRILQIVINLVSNSLKFTLPNGFVKVVISATRKNEKIEKISKEGTNGTNDTKKNLCTRPPGNVSTNTSDSLNKSDLVTVSFTVCDSGAGIAPRLQHRVFEPFVQGEIGAKETRSGAGLGLSICRDLATLMNGTISLESEVGVGSCFTFTVPMECVLLTKKKRNEGDTEKHEYQDETSCDSTDPEIQSKSSGGDSEQLFTASNEAQDLKTRNGPSLLNIINNNTDNKKNNSLGLRSATEKVSSNFNCSGPTFAGVSTSPGQNRHFATNSGMESVIEPKKLDIKICCDFRVLIAEDNRVNQEVMLKMLRLEGITGVEVAKDGLEAVEAVSKSLKEEEERGFDIIFMDIQMPNLDGIEATERIRKELGYSGPIIAVSAYADKTNVDRCHLAGMNDFLAKPIKRLQLRLMLVETFEGKEEE